ncbi:MAG: zinc ribbon domain-containing protein [Longilinea sp.]|jgi:RNase P subunit RPR2|nr:zinc ribbon domain-containing protein [Longilinea sp.]HQF62930.1 zinc ribbon domain-containing protein [Anaerolineaceae bacterium]HQH85975.1 zinc ribbon domain-containing protein [Anaerolineaceae bacterium]
MQSRIFHGDLKPADLARALMGHFHRGNLRVQQIGDREKITVQIATTNMPSAGGQTALGVAIQKVEDGIMVSVGKQAWLGVAASLGRTALQALRNPLSLLGNLDDIAQDIEYLRLSEEVWEAIDSAARAAGVSTELSERLRRMVCNYCNTANPVGEPRCIACGAPLGDVQPRTCKKCGFVARNDERFCTQCGQPL